MRTDQQQAILLQHRKPTNEASSERLHLEKDGVHEDKESIAVSRPTGARRSILSWSRPAAVSKAAVSKVAGTMQAAELEQLNEKEVGLVKGAEEQEQKDADSDSLRPSSLIEGAAGYASNDDTTRMTSNANNAANTSSDTPALPIPVIHIDKPLPAFPEQSSDIASRRAVSQPLTSSPVFRTSSKNLPATPSSSSEAPVVRRIKSHGDLLSTAFVSSGRTIERRASHQTLQTSEGLEQSSHQTLDDSVERHGKENRFIREQSSSDLLVPAPASTSFRGSLLKKRSSSLGLGRRPSAASTETIQPSKNTSSSNETGQNNRNVSSATAPASTPAYNAPRESDRKRKPSVFSGIFGGLWKSKVKEAEPDVKEETLVEVATDPSSRDPGLAILDDDGAVLGIAPRKRSSSSASVTDSLIDHGADVTAGNLQQNPDVQSQSTKTPLSPLLAPSAPQRRRYSIMHSLFRSVPSSHSAQSGKDTEESILQDAKDVHVGTDVTEYPRGPIDIPNSTLPQLPSISQDLGDISFGSLFDTGGRGSRGRSRASTRGSLQSLLSSSPRAPSPQRDRTPPASPRVGGRSRSNSQLQQSFTASDVATGTSNDTSPPACATDPQIAIGAGLHGARDQERPKSPLIDNIKKDERRRTRPFRSNSASSVSTAASSFGAPDWPRVDVHVTRPAYGRSRSSSTISNNTAIRVLSPLPEGAVPAEDSFKKPRSPAIMVTSDPLATCDYTNTSNFSTQDGTGVSLSEDPLDILGRAWRSSSISRTSDATSPGLSPVAYVSSPYLSAENDANLADAISDFVLAPPSSPAMRISGDSHTSGRSSFSVASSLASSSPPASSYGGQGSRASLIMQKTLRKRANTIGPALSSSLPPSASDGFGKTIKSGSFDSPDVLNRPGRSSSSSRLSAFFGSPASTLSSSPIESPNVWLTSRDTMPPADSDTQMPTARRSIVRRLSSSLLGSPKTPGDDWSNASSPRIPNSTLAVPSEHARDVSSGTSGDQVSPSVTSTLKRDRSHSQPSVQVKVMPDDTPVSFLARVKRLARPQDIAGLLSAKADSFHRTALRLHMQEYDFVNEAIDIAVRKLLLKLHLPRETQEIDRTMEAFAERYHACNPALFLSQDQPYILAFSIIMLHTDAFNKANKHKMSRADYVKNTKVDGISTILLEYIYDNVVYAPFVYAEDLTEVQGQRPTEKGHSGSTLSSGLKERNKLEVYKAIATGQLARLRVDMSLLVPVKNPFSYTGTVSFFDCSVLYSAFVHAHTVAIPSLSEHTSSTASPDAQRNASTLRVTRVGILERKDDMAVAGKKASSRKWKSWGVILTDDHLILLRDVAAVQNLQEQILQETGTLELPLNRSQSAHISWRSDFKPDEMLPLNDAVVLYDFTYTRYTHVFRCVLPNGRQILLRASDEDSMNLWMSTINYAATFCTTGIRLRPTSGPEYEFLNNNPLPQMLDRWPVSNMKSSLATTISAGSTVPSDEGTEGDINACPTSGGGNRDAMDTLIFARSVLSHLSAPRDTSGIRDHWHASRGDIMRSKILDLEGRIHGEQLCLASDIRDVRNIAILTPFGASSRQRLQQAARLVAGKVRKTRQMIAKLICYRECLCRNLLASERELREDRYRSPVSSKTGLHLHQSKPDKYHAVDSNTGELPQNPSMSYTQESTRMRKSASQDEISRLMRSPSLLKRSLTSQMQQPWGADVAESTPPRVTQDAISHPTFSSFAVNEQSFQNGTLQDSPPTDHGWFESVQEDSCEPAATQTDSNQLET